MTVGAPAGPQEVVEVDAVDCLFEPRPWPFAAARAAAIAANWAEALRRKPRMFDGRVLLMHRGAVETAPDGRTGLEPSAVAFDPGMVLVMDACRVGFMKRVRSPETADALVGRIDAFLARDAEPELSRMHVIRSVAEIGPAVQVSAAAYLRAMLRG